jgi:hypothetical protein
VKWARDAEAFVEMLVENPEAVGVNGELACDRCKPSPYFGLNFGVQISSTSGRTASFALPLERQRNHERDERTQEAGEKLCEVAFAATLCDEEGAEANRDPQRGQK